jgi:hypothetical protein
MPHRIFSASKWARSLFFIVFVGGLLFCISYTFAYVANHYLYSQLGLERPVSLLEVAGIVAFLYVALFGIKFGFSRGFRRAATAPDSTPHYIPHKDLSDTHITGEGMHSHTEESLEDCDELENRLKASVEELSEKEKEELKKRLAEICGIKPSEDKD